jgi:hypothetical protein
VKVRQALAAPGAEIPDLKEYLAQARRRSQTRREAFDAAKAQAAGKTREQIRDLYAAELRSRRLEMPPGEILDAEMDAITGDYRPGMRLMGRALSDLPKLVQGIFRPPV